LVKEANYRGFADPLTVLTTTIELIKIRYNGMMDEKMLTYLKMLENSSEKMNVLFKKLSSDPALSESAMHSLSHDP